MELQRCGGAGWCRAVRRVCTHSHSSREKCDCAGGGAAVGGVRGVGCDDASSGWWSALGAGDNGSAGSEGSVGSDDK